MSKFELRLPQMGESVAEATLTTWLKEVGDTIEMDEAIFEIATDKVDSEVPSEVEGVLVEKLFSVDDIIKVGDAVAIIEVAGEGVSESVAVVAEEKEEEITAQFSEIEVAKDVVTAPMADYSDTNKFYSPLVKNIAKQESISVADLDTIIGTGKEGRVTKNDILAFVENEKTVPVAVVTPEKKKEAVVSVVKPAQPVVEKEKSKAVPVSVKAGDEVIPMSRMGKLIAGYMTDSLAKSAHVQSFIEVDVTNVVNWRNKVKDSFQKREGEKLTFTPIFMEAIAVALKKYPMVNISVDGDTIIKKKSINIGMAAALPDGNLIVPVIKNADQLNLVGMASAGKRFGKQSKK